jgi:CheY-like chemotaxis protein
MAIAVLVVDDDEDSRFVVAEHLSSQGAIVIGAASAVEAYEALRHEQVDVLLADIAMPEEDGYTLIRGSAAGSYRPARRSRGGVNRVRARGRSAAGFERRFQMHLVKPVDSDALIGAVARLGRPTGAAPRARRSRTSLLIPYADQFARIGALESVMWNLAIPVWELVHASSGCLRVPACIVAMTGKRQIGQLAPFDLCCSRVVDCGAELDEWRRQLARRWTVVCNKRG